MISQLYQAISFKIRAYQDVLLKFQENKDRLYRFATDKQLSPNHIRIPIGQHNYQQPFAFSQAVAINMSNYMLFMKG